MKYIIVLFIGVCLVFSCRYIGGKRVRGDGNFTTQERSVSGFDGIESLGSFDVVLSSANESSVRVEAEGNLQPLIETTVEDNQLKIRAKRGYSLRPSQDIKIYVSAPSFGSIESAGSGNIQSQNTLSSNKRIEIRVSGSGNIDVEVNTDAISAQIAGSGNMHLSGTAKEFESGIYGSGSIKAGNLKADDASVEIAGSGNAEVFANNKLKVNVMGSGDVRHRGGAQVSSSIAGSGSVTKID